MTKIGIISDTHGFIHPNIFKIFCGVDLIIHAGDIVDHSTINELSCIATVEAVLGNMDKENPYRLREELNIEIENIKINIAHKPELENSNADVIVRGHTHIPELLKQNNRFYINPGSANPKLSIPTNKASVVILNVDGKNTEAKLLFI